MDFSPRSWGQVFHCWLPELLEHTEVNKTSEVSESSPPEQHSSRLCVQVENSFFQGKQTVLHERTCLNYGPEGLGFDIPVIHDVDVLQLQTLTASLFLTLGNRNDSCSHVFH